MDVSAYKQELVVFYVSQHLLLHVTQTQASMQRKQSWKDSQVHECHIVSTMNPHQEQGGPLEEELKWDENNFQYFFHSHTDLSLLQKKNFEIQAPFQDLHKHRQGLFPFLSEAGVRNVEIPHERPCTQGFKLRLEAKVLRILTRDLGFRLFPDKPCGPGDRGKPKVSIWKPGTLGPPQSCLTQKVLMESFK